MTTCGWRPSWSSAARVWLKYASVYQPARIFSTGRSKTSGSSRLARASASRLELQARRSAASATSSCAEEGSRVPKRCWSSCPGRASARESGCDGWRVIQPKISTDAAAAPTAPAMRAAAAHSRRCTLGREVRGGRREQHRPDEMRAAALVLLRTLLTVLVGADRHVLGTVVLGELAAAQREYCRGDRRERPERARVRPAAEPLSASHRAARSRSRPSSRAPAGAPSAARPRAARASPAAAARTPRRAGPGRAGAGCATLAARNRLRRATTLISPGDVRTAQAQAPRAVHENAVPERHAAEPDLLLGGLVHATERSRSAACSRAAAGPGRPSPTAVRRPRRPASPRGSTRS